MVLGSLFVFSFRSVTGFSLPSEFLNANLLFIIVLDISLSKLIPSQLGYYSDTARYVYAMDYMLLSFLLKLNYYFLGGRLLLLLV